MSHPDQSRPSRAARITTGAAAAGLLTAGALLLAACGGGSSKPASAPVPAPAITAPAPVATTLAPVAAVSASTIKVGSTTAGSVVVDLAGRTLYTYDPDQPNSGMSSCSGACAQAWPPAVVSGSPSAAAAIKGTVGEITRTDGGHQLTLDGRPLYRYAGDSGPGDASGNGLGGIWHVVPASAAA
jgi:predicted lipoprotein with Yx(FWY)xxD motif